MPLDMLLHAREGHAELLGKVCDPGVCVPELLQNAASGGVRERGKRGIEAGLCILNHMVQYVTHRVSACKGRSQFTSTRLSFCVLEYSRAQARKWTSGQGNAVPPLSGRRNGRPLISVVSTWMRLAISVATGMRWISSMPSVGFERKYGSLASDTVQFGVRAPVGSPRATSRAPSSSRNLSEANSPT
jgi:hypothetical protein